MMLALLFTRCPASCLCSVLLCLSLFCCVALQRVIFVSLCLCSRCSFESFVCCVLGVRGGFSLFCVSALL